MRVHISERNFIASQISDITFTDERFHPNQEGAIAYEHFHRYALACDFIINKNVLDVACGEGYGSSLMAKTANSVIGVDISEEVISHARIKYASQSNLEFRCGSCLHIPCDSNLFDVVVCFETVEHLAEHEGMLDEIISVLKQDGMLIISSPNKKTHSDDPAYKNKYHLKELHLDEFIEILNSRFKYITLMGQRLTFSSHIWPMESVASACEFIHYFIDDLRIDSSISPPYEPMYFIAICTNSSNLSKNIGRVSLFTKRNDSLCAHYNDISEQILQKEKYLQSIINSWSWKITRPLRWLYGKMIIKKSKNDHYKLKVNER